MAIMETLSLVNLQYAIAITGEVTGLPEGIKKLLGRSKRNQEVTDFFSRITDLQIKLSAALAEAEQSADIAREYKRQIREREEWDSEVGKYELRAFPSGCVVYLRRPDAEPREPPHCLCPSCVQQREKSILQPLATDGNKYMCHKCGLGAFVEQPPPPGMGSVLPPGRPWFKNVGGPVH